MGTRIMELDKACPVCGRHVPDPVPEHDRRSMDLMGKPTPCEGSGRSIEDAGNLPIVRARQTVERQSHG